MQRRAAELGGFGLGLLGLALLVALASYNPSDPSLNTATAQTATNLAGPVGASLADLLLQGFGVAGALPGLAMLAWAWRIASQRGLGSMAARLAVTGAAMPVLAAALEAVPRLRSVAWPTMAGPGGAVGRVLAPAMLDAGQGLLGPAGAVLVWVLGSAFAVTLALLALGLSGAEWRAGWRFVARIARFSVSTGWSAAIVLGRVGGAGAGLAGLLRRRWAPGRDTTERDAAGHEANRGAAPGLTGRREPAGDGARAAAAFGQAMPGGGQPRPSIRRGGPLRKPMQESLPLAEAGWRFPSLSLLKPAPAARRDRPEHGGAGGQCAAAGDGAVGLRRAGQHRGDPAGAGGDAV